MTTEKMQRIYEHFGITVENIPLQKQVRQDIHDILIKLWIRIATNKKKNLQGDWQRKKRKKTRV